MDEVIKRHKDFLEVHIDPDFGLLDKLHEVGILSLKDISKIKENCHLLERNSHLLRHILENQKGDLLLWALRHAEQTHIANYLFANGALVRVHVTLSGDEVEQKEEEIITKFKSAEGRTPVMTDVHVTAGNLRVRAVADFGQKQMSGREEVELREIVESKRRRGDATLRHCEYVAKNQSGANSYYQDHKSLALSFEKGNKMEILPLENIGDNVGWLIAKHLETGQIGFVPRNRVVLDWGQEIPRQQYMIYSSHKAKRRKLMNEKTEQNESPSTTVYDLPLEMFDIILRKSYLRFILAANQRDEDVIRSLISVDVCFYKRITGQRFRKAISRYLKDFYRKTKKGYAIIRNNRSYLLQNIQPNDNFIASLLSLACITEKQRQLILRKRSDQFKNAELLNVMRSFDESKSLNFIKCLRQTKQNTVARILENGGVSIQVAVQIRGEKFTTFMDTQLFHQRLEVLLNRTKPWSLETDKRISQLRSEGIEILNSQLDSQTAGVWIWCRSQSGLDYIWRMYESNQLRDVLFSLTSYQPSASEAIHSIVINVDSSNFKKTVVVCQISAIFNERINAEKNVRGLAKLRNEIYVLYQAVVKPPRPLPVMCVYDDQSPFRLQRKFELNEIEYLLAMASSEQNNCLYVSDDSAMCVWKITIETNNRHKIIKWLTLENMSYNMSMSADGQLLIIDGESSFSLKIYGSDAECIRSIQFPIEIGLLYHAVKTSIGTFVILHESSFKEDEEEEKKDDGDEENEDDEEEEKEDDGDEEDDDDEEEEKEDDGDEENEDNEEEEKEDDGNEEDDDEEEDEIGNEENKQDDDLDNENKENKQEEEDDDDEDKGEEMKKKQKEVGENRSGCAMDIEKRQTKEEFVNRRVEEVGGGGDIEIKSIGGKSFEGSVNKKMEEVQARGCLSEYSSDGQLLIRRFIPKNEAQQFGDPYHLLLNSDDQVFVSDKENGRVILFDEDLKWNQIVCHTKGERTDKIYYDVKKNQLLVHTISKGIDIYTLDRN